MSSSKFQMGNVVEGEASESDDDEYEEEVRTDLRSTPLQQLTTVEETISGSTTDQSSDQNRPSDSHTTTATIDVNDLQSRQGRTDGVLVFGEASESDDECQSDSIQLSVPLKVEDESGLASVSPVRKLPQFNQPAATNRHEDLLHKKLRETNERLKSHTENFRVKRIENAVKDLKIILLQLCKSQAVLKETSATLKVTSNDLFKLEDKLDIVASCTLIPYINIEPLPSQKTSIKHVSSANSLTTSTT